MQFNQIVVILKNDELFDFFVILLFIFKKDKDNDKMSLSADILLLQHKSLANIIVRIFMKNFLMHFLIGKSIQIFEMSANVKREGINALNIQQSSTHTYR